MAKQLTSGFDVAAHVTQEAVQRVFQAYYWTGNFPPDHVTETFHANGKPQSFEIFFEQPTLSFVEERGIPNAIRVSFPFIVRLTTQDNEIHSSAQITVSAQQEVVIDGDHEATVISVSFHGAGADQFTFGISSPDFDTLVKPRLLQSLVSPASPIALTPPAAQGAGFFVPKLYPKPDGNGFLGVFVNFLDDERDPPAELSIYELLVGESDLRTAIPASHIMASINAEREAMGIATSQLPATIDVDGDEVTVDALDVALHDGHLRVTGEIDDVEFEAWLGLKATDHGIEALALATEFDMPWWLDAANFLAAGAIQRTIERALPRALENVSTDLTGGIGVFGGSIPGAGFLIRIANAGNATIKTSGIILPANLEAQIEGTTLKKPTYLKGNKETKEFHRGGCFYGDKLRPEKSVPFISEAAAMHNGYNGCFTCANELSYPLARVVFGFHAASAPPGEGAEVVITVRGTLLEPVTMKGIEITNPPFSDSMAFKRHSKPGEPWERSNHALWHQLVPGLWRFRVHHGSWTGECTFKLRKTAKNFGSTNYIAFTLGKAKGSGDYDHMPAFP